MIKKWSLVFLLFFSFFTLQACFVTGPNTPNNNNNNTNNNNNNTNNNNNNTNNNNNNNNGSDGDLVVKWSFDGVEACPSNVSEIVIQIEGMKDKIVSCADGQATIPYLKAMDYSLILKGIQKDTTGGDVITWISQKVNFTILSAKKTVVSIDLQPEKQPQLRGSMLVKWSFAEGGCPNDVANIVIQIDGMKDKIVSCSDESTKIIDLNVGIYTVKLKALESNDSVFSESEEHKVEIKADQETIVTIDLKDTSQPALGSITINWTFDGKSLCPTDVDDIVIQLEGMKDKIVDCSDGHYTIENVPVGNYDLKLKGTSDDSGQSEITWESTTTQVSILEGQEANVEIDLTPAP